MSKFIRRRAEVEAIKWTGGNLDEIFTLTGRIKQDMTHGQIGIFSPGESAYRTADSGDWIVKNTSGRVFPMKPEEFEAKYEAAAPIVR